MNTPTLQISAAIASAFRLQLSRFAFTVARRRIQAGWSTRDLSHLWHEFADTATGAAHEWIASTPEPARTIAELATTELRAWPQAIYRAAFRAVERLVYPLTRTAPTPYLAIGDVRFVDRETHEAFDLFATEGEKSAAVAARCEELRQRARAELATANNGNRVYVRAVLAMIDRAEDYARACIRAERYPLDVPVTFTDTNGSDYVTLTGRGARQRAYFRARALRGFIARLADDDRDGRERLAAAFRAKLERWADRVLRDRRRKGTLTHEADLRENAVAACLLWIAEQTDPAATIARLTETPADKWPAETYVAARRAVTVTLRAIEARAPIGEAEARAFAERAIAA